VAGSGLALARAWRGTYAGSMNTVDKSTDPPARPKGKANSEPARSTGVKQPPGEIGGPKGPEPTRYGDWEKGGRVSDF